MTPMLRASGLRPDYTAVMSKLSKKQNVTLKNTIFNILLQ